MDNTERNNMKSSNEELVLSKSSAKHLRVRNAIEAATLSKETRQLQKERKYEERLFFKKREHILQRQSSLVEELTPKLRKEDIDANPSRPRILSASKFPLFDKQSLNSPRSRRRTFPEFESKNSLAVSLPDIHATCQRKPGQNKLNTSERSRKGCNRRPGEDKCEETCSIDEWKEMRKCRYLRTCSTETKECKLG